MKFRFAKDSWFSKERSIFKKGIFQYDKIQHFVGGIILGIVFELETATALGWSWEIKDGYVPYEKVGFLGGDGFSWKDGSATQLGIMFGSGFREIFKSMGVL